MVPQAEHTQRRQGGNVADLLRAGRKKGPRERASDAISNGACLTAQAFNQAIEFFE